MQAANKFFFARPSFSAVVRGLAKQRSCTSRNVRSPFRRNCDSDKTMFVNTVRPRLSRDASKHACPPENNDLSANGNSSPPPNGPKSNPGEIGEEAEQNDGDEWWKKDGIAPVWSGDQELFKILDEDFQGTSLGHIDLHVVKGKAKKLI